MERKKVEETIHTIRYEWEEAPLKVCDLPKDLLPDDKIYCISDPGHWSENNSWEPYTEYHVVRLRDQTDEEYQKEVEWWKNKIEEGRKARYEQYLRLKQEVETGKLTRHGYEMSEEEIKEYERYSDIKFPTNG
jgi:hypothetical protein